MGFVNWHFDFGYKFISSGLRAQQITADYSSREYRAPRSTVQELSSHLRHAMVALA